MTLLQTLARCRDEVCEALNLKHEDVELSMGMSGDFEEAVSALSQFWCCSLDVAFIPCVIMIVSGHPSSLAQAIPEVKPLPITMVQLQCVWCLSC